MPTTLPIFAVIHFQPNPFKDFAKFKMQPISIVKVVAASVVMTLSSKGLDGKMNIQYLLNERVNLLYKFVEINSLKSIGCNLIEQCDDTNIRRLFAKSSRNSSVI